MTQHSFHLFVKYLAGFLSLLLAGCSTSGWLTRTDFSPQYNNPPGMAVTVFSVNDSLTEVKVRVPVMWCTPSKGYRQIIIHHSLFNSFRESRLIDSLSTIVSDSNQLADFIFFTGTLKVPTGSSYVLKSDFTDINGKKEASFITVFSKNGTSDPSSFFVENYSGATLMEPSIPVNYLVRIGHPDVSIRQLFCKGYFHHNQELMPPYIEKERKPFDYSADTGFILPVGNGTTGFFQLAKKGFYFFQTDTTDSHGFTLVATNGDYPSVTTPWLMLEPIQYLTSTVEYEAMAKNFDGKATVDSFWVTSTGSAERALELIRKYYHRVEDANRMFTSFCEGWKTDRGMIYCVFGPPNVVYRSDTEEIWTYGEITNNRSMQFVFLKVMNRFSENDFILYRQANYKLYWYHAVRQWRR